MSNNIIQSLSSTEELQVGTGDKTIFFVVGSVLHVTTAKCTVANMFLDKNINGIIMAGRIVSIITWEL